MASPTKEIQKAANSIADSGKNNTGADKAKTSGRLFFLDAGGGRVFSANADGSDMKIIISEGRKFPDGLWLTRLPDISTGPTWATPLSMTVPSSAPTSCALSK